MTYQLPVWETVAAASIKLDGAKKSMLAAFALSLLAVGSLKFFAHYADIHDYAISSDLIELASTLIYILFGVGLLFLGIKRALNSPISYKMSFKAFKPKTVFSVLGFELMRLLIFIPCFLLMSVNLTLFIIATLVVLYFYIRLSLAKSFVIMEDINPLRAIKLSFRATRWNVLRLLGLFVIKLGLSFATMVSLGIGLIWTAPLYFIIEGEIFNRLSHRSDLLVNEK